MEHHEPEHPVRGEARTAEVVVPENHEVLSEPSEPPQDKDAEEADGAAGEQEPVDEALLPAQGQGNLESPPPDASSSQEGPAQGTQPEVETAGACSWPQELPQSPRARQPELDFYCVKWIPWKGERTPIITQSTNGPCPLIAIMNILFLQWKVKLPPQKEVIASDELMAHLGDCLLSIKPQEKSEGLQLNFQQSPEAVSAVGKLSYNQLVEKIITCKHSSDTNLVTEGLIAEQFLETTAAQLTYHGLCELTTAAKEGELSVFFRNNHFSTMTKHKGHLYLLVTDQGFLQEEQVVWESLHNVDGDSCFCDSDFHLSHSLGKGPGAEGGSGSPEKQRQVDQDYLIALSLQQQPSSQGTLGLSDLELAQQLQQEEYQQHQAAQPVAARALLPQGRGAAFGRPAAERRQRPKQESDCVLL
ncbi:ubiquitin carboxyl-terminal hydrolase MINDY-1 isoform X3 [Sagmatias obliquidens]|uniref:Ubiquitin carboxyl-terminal hydrolase n=1 Tax=Tursiops truncatus TaxID=9739 RepID=A0A6J3RN17_TURTR|nr:ubiquitin carboxyl-terminal hydrolase MINDY-1 isoform X3 [Lagenorhynchus obliquidens]XP_030702289.1 ubiquitin carboxyl-terminal hydrolase MINDY-1 isoform X3 [Globicephala melas]XP_033715744.1 ubiquitin carboxyl-terminal hydrolase MINDY-1 isoform X3 [Tursiops truncatus]XP_059885528.1 ubiquitin carboxyl-terminal hydrolase MINDY-1 isoform X2 [Delphinus delphis]